MKTLENIVWFFVQKMYHSRMPKKVTDKVYDIFCAPLRKINEKGE